MKIRKTSKEYLEEYIKECIGGKKFKLKKWNFPNDNPNWSHDHCRICMKEISKEKESYTDGGNSDWICKNCFKENKDKFNLKKLK